MPIRAVFFDVGETLVDETRMWEAWADVLGLPRLTLLGVLGGLAARGDDHREVFTRLAPGADLERAQAEMRERGLFDGFGAQDLYPDALPCLHALHGAGFRTGIVGNTTTAVEQALRELDAPVDVIASSERWGVAKPAPEFFARVLEASRVSPAELAYVGDRVDNDVVPAATAGMVAVHVRRGPWGHLQADWPEASLAAIRVRSLGDLPAALVARR